MIKVLVKEEAPIAGLDGPSIDKEPDSWLIDTFEPNFSTDAAILIRFSKDGASVLPFVTLGRFKRVFVVEEREHFANVYCTLKGKIHPETKVLMSDERPEDMEFEYRLCGYKKHYRNAEDSKPHCCTPIYGMDFVTKLVPSSCYMRYREMGKEMVHCRWPWGQRKNVLFIMQFLNLYQSYSKHIVYIGNASGTHINTVCRLYPHLTFDMWTPSPFFEESLSVPNLIINNFEFSDKVCDAYAGKKFTFISDLYRVDSIDGLYPSALDINRDLMDQQRWAQKIGGISCLKFVLPWATQGDIKVEGIDGIRYFQAWAPKSSTEVRLHTRAATAKKVEYSSKEHEELMAFFNNYTRNGLYERKQVPVDDYCYCYDCTLEIDTICNYLEIMKQKVTVQDIMKVSALITNTITPRFASNYLGYQKDIKSAYQKVYTINGLPIHYVHEEPPEDLLEEKRKIPGVAELPPAVEGVTV
jgi:hypothetical protein